jgi:hypothetical protein
MELIRNSAISAVSAFVLGRSSAAGGDPKVARPGKKAGEKMGGWLTAQR